MIIIGGGGMMNGMKMISNSPLGSAPVIAQRLDPFRVHSVEHHVDPPPELSLLLAADLLCDLRENFVLQKTEHC
jgi:hypothetical protein